MPALRWQSYDGSLIRAPVVKQRGVCLLLAARSASSRFVTASCLTLPPTLLSAQRLRTRCSCILFSARLACRAVLLMDDFDRENEADLIVSAEKIGVESMARLIRDCSGIVCLCLDREAADRLEIGRAHV